MGYSSAKYLHQLGRAIPVKDSGNMVLVRDDSGNILGGRYGNYTVTPVSCRCPEFVRNMALAAMDEAGKEFPEEYPGKGCKHQRALLGLMKVYDLEAERDALPIEEQITVRSFEIVEKNLHATRDLAAEQRKAGVTGEITVRAVRTKVPAILVTAPEGVNFVNPVTGKERNTWVYGLPRDEQGNLLMSVEEGVALVNDNWEGYTASPTEWGGDYSRLSPLVEAPKQA